MSHEVLTPTAEIEKKFPFDPGDLNLREVSERIQTVLPELELEAAFRETSYYLINHPLSEVRGTLQGVLRRFMGDNETNPNSSINLSQPNDEKRAEISLLNVNAIEHTNVLDAIDLYTEEQRKLLASNLPGIVRELSRPEHDENANLSARIKHRRNSEGHFRSLIFKSALHGTTRDEYPEMTITWAEEEAITESLGVESIWEASRVKLGSSSLGATIDVQFVTGYGWTMEIEAPSEATVDYLAGLLGVDPFNSTQLDAMYKLYLEKYGNEHPAAHSTFNEKDWRKIAEEAGGLPPFNTI